MNAIDVDGSGNLTFQGRQFRCAIGRSGIVAAKQEGDGATPAGAFPLRQVFYRPDRLARPQSRLEVSPLDPSDGWCDAPDDPAYNQLVQLPHGASAEQLWREDRLYDLIVVVGYNDAPTVPGCGSAIFLHIARPDWGPTEGCVALTHDDLNEVLRECDPDTLLRVRPPADQPG